MPRFADHLTDVADILHSTAEAGEVRVNFGEETTGEGFRADVQVWGPDGFISRPNDPSDAGVCQALYLVDGQQQRVIATRDNRFASQAGTLAPGDRAIVTDAACRILMKRERAAVALYTEMHDDPPAGGKSMLLDLGGDTGRIHLRAGGAEIILDGQAGTITLIAAGPAGAATLVLDGAKGASLKAGVVNLDAPFVTGGLNSDGTRPGKPGVDTALVGALGQSGVASPHVFLANY